MIEARVGRRYARALFQIALEDGSVDAIASELAAVSEAMAASKDLRQVLTFPTHSLELRRGVFGSIADRLGTGPVVRNFVNLLLERNRMSAFDACLQSFRARADEHLGQVRGEVVSARPLSTEQLDAVRSKLEQTTGKQVLLEVREDPALLGGLVARVGNTVYDGSLKTRLDGIQRAMSDSTHG